MAEYIAGFYEGGKRDLRAELKKANEESLQIQKDLLKYAKNLSESFNRLQEDLADLRAENKMMREEIKVLREQTAPASTVVKRKNFTQG